MKTRLMVLSEDSQGSRFFRDLFTRLKDEKRISKGLHTKSERFFGPCNQKLERQMKPMLSERGYNFFIVAADADGGPCSKLTKRIETHVPVAMKAITRYLIFTYEVEEWICFSLEVKINDKPSVILDHKFGYKKYRLAEYVQKLDFKKLKACRSFCNFVKYISEIDPDSRITD